MKQKLVPFSMLLIILLLIGTVSAYTDNIVDANSAREENIREETISEENISEEISEENASEDILEETTSEEEKWEEENPEETSSEDFSEEETYEESSLEEFTEEENEEEFAEEENEEEFTEEENEEEFTEEENEEEFTEEENGEEFTEEETEGEFTEEETEGEFTEEENEEGFTEEENEEEFTEEETEGEFTEEENEADTNRIIELSYNKSGPFKIEDVVGITASFNRPIVLATLTVNDEFSSPIDMVRINDTVWYCDYVTPGDFNGPVDITVSAVDKEENNIDETYTEAFVIDNTAPELTVVDPVSNFASTNSVLFNFTALDEFDNNVTYTLYINDTERSTGSIVTDECKTIEIELAEGHYIWEAKLEDDAGNIGSSEPIDLYVDTEAPKVTLISPKDNIVNKEGFLNFSFIARDDFTAQYEDLSLHYDLWIDGESIDENSSGNMLNGEYVEIPCADLSEGAHTWSVYIEDGAGNNVTSEDRNFYINQEGLRVLLISPDDEYASKNTTFRFRVSGGSGMPFDYKLFINDKEVESTAFEEGGEEEEEDEEDNSLEEEEDNSISESYEEENNRLGEEEDEEDNSLEEEEDNASKEEENSIYQEEVNSFLERCQKEDEDSVFEESENTLFLGEDQANYYYVNAEVADGEDMTWTVFITDCSGNTYEPEPLSFSLDTVAPARITNLKVTEAAEGAELADTYDYPILYASWNENTEDDLAPMPYEVYISDFSPSTPEDMEKAGDTSDSSFYIEEYGGEPLVYGKDYWIAVIAKDKVGNYNNCFIAISGPVKISENMNSANLRSTTSNTDTAFLTETETSESLGNSTANTYPEILKEVEESGSLEYSNSNISSGFMAENKKYEKLKEKPRSEFIINLIPEMSKTGMKLENEDLLDKQVAESSENYPEIKSSPGFNTIYAVAGILLLTFRLNIRRKMGKKI